MSSAFRRLVTALPGPQSRRAYSVFSSKSGGGRYFNSAKTKAPAVAPAKAKSDTASSAKDASTSSSSSATAATSDGTSTSEPSTSRTVADTPGVVDPVIASPAEQALADSVDDFAAHTTAHPTPSTSDYKLHQFFSLHRPLLLLNNPPSMFTPGPSFQTVLQRSEGSATSQEKVPVSVFDDYPTEAHLDADAIAARQLGRALAMSRLGSAAAWESTLKHLGLDPAKEPERIEMQGQMDKDWEDVQILLDSTKRKRRKKMKKHK